MNLSGILVVARPERLSAVISELDALPGIEVHQVDEATGRIVVVQEAASLEAEMEGLKRIQATPGVTLAALVYHYFGDETDAAATPSDPVPAFLQD